MRVRVFNRALGKAGVCKEAGAGGFRFGIQGDADMVELAAFMVVCWMGWKFVRAVWAHRHAVARKMKSALKVAGWALAWAFYWFLLSRFLAPLHAAGYLPLFHLPEPWVSIVSAALIAGWGLVALLACVHHSRQYFATLTHTCAARRAKLEAGLLFSTWFVPVTAILVVVKVALLVCVQTVVPFLPVLLGMAAVNWVVKGYFAATSGIVAWFVKAEEAREALPIRSTDDPATQAMIRNLLCDDSGQDMIEYALIAAVIAVAALWSFGNLSNNIGNLFNSVGNELAGGAGGQ